MRRPGARGRGRSVAALNGFRPRPSPPTQLQPRSVLFPERRRILTKAQQVQSSVNAGGRHHHHPRTRRTVAEGAHAKVPRSSPAHQVPHDQAADGTDGEAVKEQPRECAEAQNKHREHAIIALHRSPAAMPPKSRATLHCHGERVKTAPGKGRRAVRRRRGNCAVQLAREGACCRDGG